jgi:hypothetical protein
MNRPAEASVPLQFTGHSWAVGDKTTQLGEAPADVSRLWIITLELDGRRVTIGAHPSE